MLCYVTIGFSNFRCGMCDGTIEETLCDSQHGFVMRFLASVYGVQGQQNSVDFAVPKLAER